MIAAVIDPPDFDRQPVGDLATVVVEMQPFRPDRLVRLPDPFTLIARAVTSLPVSSRAQQTSPSMRSNASPARWSSLDEVADRRSGHKPLENCKKTIGRQSVAGTSNSCLKPKRPALATGSAIITANAVRAASLRQGWCTVLPGSWRIPWMFRAKRTHLTQTCTIEFVIWQRSPPRYFDELVGGTSATHGRMICSSVKATGL